MAKYGRSEVFMAMKDTGVVPVFFHKDIEVCKQVVKACYDGGIRVFEFVNRGDFAHEIFSELNKYVLSELPGMILGAGSVVEAATAAIFIQSGANFIVSPLLEGDSSYVTDVRGRHQDVCIISELKAQELVLRLSSSFCLEIGGPSFVAVKGPMPWTISCLLRR